MCLQYWDDIQRWQTANLPDTTGVPEENHHVVVDVHMPADDEETHRTLWLLLLILVVVNGALFCVLLALAKHTGFRLG